MKVPCVRINYATREQYNDRKVSNSGCYPLQELVSYHKKADASIFLIIEHVCVIS